MEMVLIDSAIVEHYCRRICFEWERLMYWIIETYRKKRRIVQLLRQSQFNKVFQRNSHSAFIDATHWITSPAMKLLESRGFLNCWFWQRRMRNFRFHLIRNCAYLPTRVTQIDVIQKTICVLDFLWTSTRSSSRSRLNLSRINERCASFILLWSARCLFIQLFELLVFSRSCLCSIDLFIVSLMAITKHVLRDTPSVMCVLFCFAFPSIALFTHCVCSQFIFRSRFIFFRAWNHIHSIMFRIHRVNVLLNISH